MSASSSDADQTVAEPLSAVPLPLLPLAGGAVNATTCCSGDSCSFG